MSRWVELVWLLAVWCNENNKGSLLFILLTHRTTLYIYCRITFSLKYSNYHINKERKKLLIITIIKLYPKIPLVITLMYKFFLSDLIIQSLPLPNYPIPKRGSMYLSWFGFWSGETWRRLKKEQIPCLALKNLPFPYVLIKNWFSLVCLYFRFFFPYMSFLYDAVPCLREGSSQGRDRVRDGLVCHQVLPISKSHWRPLQTTQIFEPNCSTHCFCQLPLNTEITYDLVARSIRVGRG